MESVPSGRERRRHPRFCETAEVLFMEVPGPLSGRLGTVRDVSESGLSFVTSHQPILKNRIILGFDLDGREDLVLEACVRRCVREGDANFVGVEFSRLGLKQRRGLERLRGHLAARRRQGAGGVSGPLHSAAS